MDLAAIDAELARRSAGQGGGVDLSAIDAELARRGAGAAPKAKPYEGWADYGTDLARMIAQGASLGTSDEITAAVRSVRPYSGSVGPGRSAAAQTRPDGMLPESAVGEAAYDEALKTERDAVRRFSDVNPATSIAAQIGGGLATAPFLPIARGATLAGTIGKNAMTGAGYGAAAGFASGEEGGRTEGALKGAAVGGALGGVFSSAVDGGRAIRRAYANQGQSGAYGTIADDLPGGVDALANQIATGGSRGNVTTNRRTLDILGEEMQRANGNTQVAQQAAIARIVQEANVTPATAATQIRRLTQVQENSPLFLGEYPAVSGSDTAQRLRQAGNANVDELGRIQDSATQGKIDYLSNNGNSQSAANVRNAIAQRQESLAPTMREGLESMGPKLSNGRPANIADTEDMIGGARQMAQREYDVAYSTPTASPQRLTQLPRFFEYLANRAASSSPEVAATIRNAVNQIAVRMPDGSLGVQSLRQMQTGRTTLRGQITALERAGRSDLAQQVRPLYRLTTRVMEEMSPSWAQANRRWADMNFNEIAQDLGDAFSQKAGPKYRTQVTEFRRMAPEAQNIVRVHVLQKQLDKLDDLGDTHSVSKFFSNDQSRNMIRTIFGDDAAVSFARAVRDQRVAERTQGMMSNSATHRRGIAQRQMDAETGLVAAVEGANVRGVRNWLLERATQLLTERRNRPMADILTTPLNDTARVAQHLFNMRTQQERLRKLSGPSRHTGRAAAFGGATAGQNVNGGE